MFLLALGLFHYWNSYIYNRFSITCFWLEVQYHRLLCSLSLEKLSGLVICISYKRLSASVQHQRPSTEHSKHHHLVKQLAEYVPACRNMWLIVHIQYTSKWVKLHVMWFVHDMRIRWHCCSRPGPVHVRMSVGRKVVSMSCWRWLVSKLDSFSLHF